mgnify:CR=1 FL=1
MRRLKGTVISNKSAKTAVVRIDRLVKHPKYGKYYRMSKKCKAHDPEGESKAGDIVIIEESRPISKDKRWRIVERVSRAPKVAEGE